MIRLAIDILLLAVIAGFIFVYGRTLFANMSATASATGKGARLETASGLSWLWIKIEGWKTIACSWAATVCGFFAAIPAETLQTWSGLPFSQIVDQKIAGYLTIGLTLAAGLFHSQATKQMAQTPPQDS